MKINVKQKPFSKRLAGKGKKANFRRTTKRFFVENRQLYYKASRLAVADKDRQVDIIYDICKGSGDTSH